MNLVKYSLEIFFLCVCICGYVRPEPEPKVVGQVENDLKISVQSDAGKQYDLNLVKADASAVLHPDIKVISINTDKESGHLSYDSWTPSKRELEDVQNIYVDEANLAAVRVAYENGNRAIEGVVDGKRFVERSGQATLSEMPAQNRSDYIDMGRKLTTNATNRNSAGSVNAIVETALICDKEFGDLFQHNRQRILDYFTVYFWDVNLRYKTLPSNNVAFRINTIVVISTTSGQPFIEEARASDGRAEFGRILERFSFWVYKQMGSLPKFDIAIAITNTRLEWGGGLAYMRTACWIDQNAKRHYGTLVFNDDGGWGSLTVGAHEIGHSVGAPHDDDPNFPGGCQDRGYIMSGGNDDLKWFFSTCSDRVIGEYARSNEGACLRRLDEPGSPTINPNFSGVLAPPMAEQCKRRLKNQQAFVPEEDTANCKVMKCWVPNQNGNGWVIWFMAPVDNTPCLGGGRCFRGRCRKLGSLIRNVGSGKCIRATNPFAFMAILDMVDCPTPGTPLDRFVIADGNSGKTLATPFSSTDGKENADKCVYTGGGEGSTLWTDRCNAQNQWHGWDFIDVGNSEFLLSHRVTRRCAKPSGTYVGSYANCDRNDRNMRWKLQ